MLQTGLSLCLWRIPGPTIWDEDTNRVMPISLGVYGVQAVELEVDPKSGKVTC